MVHSDMQLCVNQLNGVWRVTKPHLVRLRYKVLRLAGDMDVEFRWVRRGNAWISRCDAMANEVLAGRRG